MKIYRDLRPPVKLCAVAAIFLASFSLTLADDVPPNALVGDTFTLNGTTRKEGERLLRLPSEVGGVLWTATDHLHFTADGKITSETNTGVVGSLPLASVAKPLTVQADFNMEGSANVALAFAHDGDPVLYWKNIQLMACLTKAGHYLVFADGVKRKLADGNVKTPLPTGAMSHLEFTYDPTAKKVSLKINGEMAVDGISIGDYAPNITFACFRFQEPVEPMIPQVDNFFVTGEK